MNRATLSLVGAPTLVKARFRAQGVGPFLLLPTSNLIGVIPPPSHRSRLSLECLRGAVYCQSLSSRPGEMDELRVLDLEVEMLSLKSQMLSSEQAAINAR
jgi:hypothetical protein